MIRCIIPVREVDAIGNVCNWIHTTMKTQRKKKLNRFEAAIHVRMSPKLLGWLTRYAPKWGDAIKLSFETKDGEIYFSPKELKEFDKYLAQPWPKKNTETRPHVPAGIVAEIKEECGHKCAICGESIGEIAHIDPVHNSRNNHPHNLIYLCPTCHTKYDSKKMLTESEIRSIKKEILQVRMSFWRSQAGLLNSVYALIARLQSVSEALNKHPHPVAVLSQLSSELFTEIREQLDSEQVNGSEAVNHQLAEKQPENILEEDLFVARSQALAETGLEECPVCEGSGTHNADECPVCRGMGTVDARVFDEIDMSLFDQRECPVCEGSGTHNFWECPVCRGIGTIDARDFEEIDESLFDQRECPVCEGSGTHNADECVVCRGIGTVDARDFEEIDESLFDQRECPVCEGSGTHNADECPVCQGIGTVDARIFDEIDMSLFDQRECPVCDGSGTHNADECPVCQGIGTVDARIFDEIDVSRFR